MDETILFPSPNWFQSSGLAVSCDEWLIYGGPTKSLSVLEPLPRDYDTIVKGHQGYTAHVVIKAHPEKVVCVDICPEWPEKRCILTGSADGIVKQWILDKSQNNLKIKSTHSHEIHNHEKEDIAGVGYCKDRYAVTVGTYGVIVKWDLNSNVAKSFKHVLKNFKPVCMACSPHLHMQVAIGTKQGVLFVLDLNGAPRIVYKVRAQDDEILKVSWCPQYEVAVRKALKDLKEEKAAKRKGPSDRMKKIRQVPESPETLKLLDERVKNSETAEQPVLINEKCEAIPDVPPMQEMLDESGVTKILPDDSFDEIVVQEDDTFDIYKDHEADEFGHKKYQPVDVLVKIPTEVVKEDYLTECEKLKEDILKRKSQSDSTIGELVDALEKTQLEAQPSSSKQEPPMEGKIIKGEVESSVHIHKHLLATLGKQGSIRIWSKSGKMVGSCVVFSSTGGKAKQQQQQQRNSTCSTLVWARTDTLLIADGKSQLLDCNPLKIDCRNKLECRILHSAHARGLFAIATNAPRVQTPDMHAQNSEVAVWTAGQDRNLVRYCLNTGETVTHNTCGGFLYTVKPCPYDAKRIAISVGDGAVRVWEVDTQSEDDSKLCASHFYKYWQNVLGKVLVTAWHPQKENLLAFATAESRVGIIDTCGKSERASIVLQPVLKGGVYSLCWTAGAGAGAGEVGLCAVAGGELVRYSLLRPDQAPETIKVELEGAKWDVSAIQWYPHRILVGSNSGSVAVLHQDYTIEATAFVFNKMVHTVEWHPQGLSDSSSSPHRALIAACSLDKGNAVVILQYGDKEDGTKQLTVWKKLTGHTNTVLQVSWNPHREEQVLSTSQDGTVRVWDITTEECISIFGGHGVSTLGACWSPFPSLPDAVLSGGGDCCLRLWNTRHHRADTYQELKHETDTKKNKNNKNRREKKKQEKKEGEEDEDCVADDLPPEEQAVVAASIKRIYNNKFLFPLVYKQITCCDVRGARKMLQRYLEKTSGATTTQGVDGPGLDYIQLFGNINELNQLLDHEMERHEDTGNFEAWAVLGVVRGYVEAVVRGAARREMLDPFLLTMAPAVSFKYWKETTLQYVQQIDRLVAKVDDHRLAEVKPYGGAIFRKVAVLLSLHDVKAAVNTLIDARLFKEAYVLSRTRYMESLAGGALLLWAQHATLQNNLNLAAVCYIALGDLSQAAAVLGKSMDEDSLLLAADIAKLLGQNTLASHMHEKREHIKLEREMNQQEDEQLEELPTRVELEIREAEEKANSTEDTTGEDEIEDNAENAESQSKDIDLEEAAAHGQQASKDEVKDEIVLRETVPEQAIGDHKVEDTAALLESLPQKMQGLMKDVVPNGTHKGDGDTIQNSVDRCNKDLSAIATEKGDELSHESHDVAA